MSEDSRSSAERLSDQVFVLEFDATASDPQPRAKKRDVYPLVWRWHFYAGLLTLPILWIVTLTGAIYVFRTELAELRDRALLVVAPGPERKTYEELKRIAAESLAEGELEAIALYPEPDRSVHFVAHLESESPSATHEERHAHIYLNPYTGEVLGTQIAEEDFFHIVLMLHRNLLMGTSGRYLTELVTSWTVILTLTGVFLWWPRGKSNVAVWVPRLKGKLYAVLRDWHAVLGAYLAPLIVIFSVTGLIFSVILGSTVFNNTVKAIGHWPREFFEAPKITPPSEDAQVASLDDVVPTCLSQSRPGDLVRIRFSPKPERAYRAYMIQGEDKNSYRAVDVDPYTGELMGVIDPPDLPFMYRVRLWSVSTHMGQIFGMPTKILALITSLAVFGLSFTGMWMWLKRRPAGRSGFPRRPTSSLPWWGWAIVVLTGVLLPVAGASFLVAGVFDAVVGRMGSRNQPATA